MSMVAACLDIFLTPYLFELIWNATIHEMFTSVPSIQYYQSLLIKLALIIYLRDVFSNYNAYSMAFDMQEYFASCIIHTIQKATPQPRLIAMREVEPYTHNMV